MPIVIVMLRRVRIGFLDCLLLLDRLLARLTFCVRSGNYLSGGAFLYH